MIRYNLQILGISEVRRNGFGEFRTPNGLTFLYSGKEDEDDVREYGVGLLLSETTKKSLIDWKPVSERIITARFNSRARKITVVQCYAPTNVASEEDKDDFYSALQQTMSNIRKQDIVIVMGDLNAKVGNNNLNCEKHMGQQGLGTRNDNGERFVEFCQNHNLVIGGTLFPHKDIHKYSWLSPDGVTRNQIDHLAISRTWRTSLLDVRNRRGADIDSDHLLMVAEVRLKLATVNRTSGASKMGRRYDVSKLKEPEVRREFALELRNRFSGLPLDTNNIDETWKFIKTAYQETSASILGHRPRKRDEWISHFTWDLIETRRELNLKIQTSTDDSERADAREKYRQLRRSIYRSTRRDRRNWANGIAEQAQRAADAGNVRDLYNATKSLTGKRGYRKRALRDIDGRLITTSEGQLARWREHFKSVFHSSPTDRQDSTGTTLASHLLDINTSSPSKEEIKMAILSLKNNKAPGIDLLTAEMLKADIELSARALTPLLERIWTTEELPDEWNKGLLITVPKKGDLSQCGNWRGITLLSTPSKVLTRILLNRITKAVEPILRREQAGFRPNRSCTDQINTLRIILEEASEWQREIYLTFVDFEKAFDTVTWCSIWCRLEEIGVPSKIINMLRALYKKYACKVAHDGLISDDIDVSAGDQLTILHVKFTSQSSFRVEVEWEY
ncbi:unnamed protein product [Colias eurytheme]|nr:unnamed protein product [Colias eurytheme]